MPCVTGEYSFLPTTVLVEGTDLPGEEVLSYIKSFRRVSLLWIFETFGLKTFVDEPEICCAD